ncbi:MAG: archaetidylserine decarboxylase [Bacteroidales bacterium]
MGIIYRLVTSRFFQRSGLARRLNTLMGRVADWRKPSWVIRMVIRRYIRRYSINMDDFCNENETYRSFNQFFTRPLQPLARTFAQGIASPAEGVITAAGNFTNHQLFHVKGNHYPLQELLQMPGFGSGSFATIYLSPADYHRVHAPFDCTIRSIRHINGLVHTVDPSFAEKIPELYCTNERVVMQGDSDYGNFFLILVGALVVGRIRLNIVENFHKGYDAADLSLRLARGDEIGLFELGSTVLLIMEKEHLSGAAVLTERHIKLGEALSPADIKS